MSARLIIRLPASPGEPFDWALVSAAEGVLMDGCGDSVEALPEGTVIECTVALIPADLIHLRHLTIPARSERAAQQAAPFAIEEYLAAPLDTQLIACGLPDGANQRWVAALDAGLAGAWGALAERVAIRPVYAVSEAMLLSPGEDALACAFIDGRIVWRSRSGAGGLAGGAPDAVSDLVLPALAGAVSAQTISLSGGHASHHAALDGYPVRDGPALDVYQAAGALDLATLKAAPAVLGARLAASADWNAMLQPWRRAAALALTTGALALAIVAAEGVWLSREAQRFEAASLSAFTAAFPDVRRVVNPRVQLEQRLREMDVASGGADSFLALTSALAGVVSEAPHIDITAVRFQADRAELSVAARYRDFADFEALRSAGEAAGLQLEDAGARQGAEGVDGEFIVRWRE